MYKFIICLLPEKESEYNERISLLTNPPCNLEEVVFFPRIRIEYFTASTPRHTKLPAVQTVLLTFKGYMTAQVPCILRLGEEEELPIS